MENRIKKKAEIKLEEKHSRMKPKIWSWRFCMIEFMSEWNSFRSMLQSLSEKADGKSISENFILFLEMIVKSMNQ